MTPDDLGRSLVFGPMHSSSLGSLQPLHKTHEQVKQSSMHIPSYEDTHHSNLRKQNASIH